MPLPPWVWTDPDPVVANQTLILADHLNDIRDAIDNTRASLMSDSGHSTTHAVGGSDPIVDSLFLNEYKYLGTRYGLLSGDPVSFSGHLSNNAWKSGPGAFTRVSDVVRSTVVTVSEDGMSVGSIPPSSTTLTNKLTVDLPNSLLSFSGKISSSTLEITGNASIAGSLSVGSIVGDVAINSATINSLTATSASIKDLSAEDIVVDRISASSLDVLDFSTDLLTAKGILLSSSDSEVLTKRLLTIKSVDPNSDTKLVVIPRILVGSKRYNFHILTTTDNDALNSAVDTLDIDSGTLKLQSTGYGTRRRVVIGSGSLGNGVVNSADYTGVDINESLCVYDRDTLSGILRFYPTSDSQALITYSPSSSGLHIIGQGASGERLVSIYDRLNVSKQITVPEGEHLSAIDSSGDLCIGQTTGNNVVFDNTSVQARSGLTAASTLYLNPFGGIVNMFNSTSGTLLINGNASITNLLTAKYIGMTGGSGAILIQLGSGAWIGRASGTNKIVLQSGDRQWILDTDGWRIYREL